VVPATAEAAQVAETPIDVPSSLVVPLDGTEFGLRALTVAARLAPVFGAGLVAVTADPGATGPTAPAWLAALVSEVAPRLQITVAPTDDPVRAVSEFAAATPGVAVCMSTHGHPVGIDEIAQRVVRTVDVPVLLVGPHCSPAAPNGPVVVAHDGTPTVHAVLGPARAWATACGRSLVLVHVRNLLDFGSDDELRATLRAAADVLGPDTAVEVVRDSLPAAAIRELARELDASLLAVSTRGRTGSLTASLGKTASWVTRESPCPVLVAHASDEEHIVP
jgi:nucleotide-binding universal stress UspA family protein